MKLTGIPAIIAFIVYATLLIWSVYFTYRIAVHVQAWPFGSVIG